MMELAWLSGIYQEFLRDFTVPKKVAAWTLRVLVWVWPFANTLSKHTDKLFMYGAQSMWVQRSALRWKGRKNKAPCPPKGKLRSSRLFLNWLRLGCAREE